MMLTVTRPIEQAIMEVPGIRRVRSRSIRGAAEISAQFDAATDMVVALQQVQNRVAEIRGELACRCGADGRAAHAGGVPGLHPQHDRGAADRRSERLRHLCRAAGAGARARRRQDRSAGERYARDRSRCSTRSKLTGAAPHRQGRRQRAEAQNQLAPVGRFDESGQQHLALASGLWTSPADIAAAPVLVEERRDHSRLATSARSCPARRIERCSSPATAATPSRSAFRSRSAPTSSPLKQGVDAALADLATTLPSGHHDHQGLRPRRIRRDAIASVRDAILIGGLLAIVVLIVFLRNFRLTLIAAITLPLAVIPTFVFMRIFGGTINQMSMGGLAVAIGLVIDDAVVVVENIHRRANEGADAVVQRGLRVDGAARQLHADHGGGVRAARPAVRRPRPVLPRALDQPDRRGAPVAGVVGDAGAAAGEVGVATAARSRERARRAGSIAGIAGVLDASCAIASLVVAMACCSPWRRSGSSCRRRHRVSAAGGRGRLRRRLPDARWQRADETDRQVRAMEKVIADTPEVAAYSRRTGSELGPVRNRAEHRRHPGPAQAARRSRAASPKR